MSFKKLGCYKDNQQEGARPLPELLFTDLDTSSFLYSGTKYAKDIMDSFYLNDLVERCAVKTKDSGFIVFGIERVGMV